MAADADGDELIYTWETDFGFIGPDPASSLMMNKLNGAATGIRVVWRPDRGGTQEVLLTVSDGKDTATDRLSVFVEPTK